MFKYGGSKTFALIPQWLLEHKYDIISNSILDIKILNVFINFVKMITF